MAPTVSLVISTYNRPQALDRVLASVARQRVLPDQVLVADDGSGLETARVVARWQQGAGLAAGMPSGTGSVSVGGAASGVGAVAGTGSAPATGARVPAAAPATASPLAGRLLHVWQPDEGFRLSAARNRAIREATGELIVFVDGDCLLRPDFVEAHQQVAERGFATAGNRVLLGQAVTADIEAGRQNPAGLVVPALADGLAAGGCQSRAGAAAPAGTVVASGCPDGPWRHFKGCNMALWRDDLVRLNGFEEEIAGWGFEDTDLILRWFNLGGRLKSGRLPPRCCTCGTARRRVMPPNRTNDVPAWPAAGGLPPPCADWPNCRSTTTTPRPEGSDSCCL